MIMIKAIREIWILREIERRANIKKKSKIGRKESVRKRIEDRHPSHFLLFLFADHDHWIICPLLGIFLSCLFQFSCVCDDDAFDEDFLTSFDASLLFADSFCRRDICSDRESLEQTTCDDETSQRRKEIVFCSTRHDPRRL
jgi:hypothetical protein